LKALNTGVRQGHGLSTLLFTMIK